MSIRIKLKPRWRSYFNPYDRNSWNYEHDNPFEAEYAQLVLYQPGGDSRTRGRYKVLMEVSSEIARATSNAGYQVESGMPVYFIAEPVVEDMSGYIFNPEDWKLAPHRSGGDMIPAKTVTVPQDYETQLDAARAIARRLLR